MDYEQLLKDAYENIKQQEQCERFELIKVKGHYEGTKTIISNFSMIADCLRRSRNHLMKFLSKELASSAEVCGDRLILSRKLPSAIVNERLEKYVKRYVLCSNCGKPDTELNTHLARVYLKCLACGETKEVPKI